MADPNSLAVASRVQPTSLGRLSEAVRPKGNPDISPTVKKLIVIVLLVPSSLFWLIFSAFGLAYFQIMAFASIEFFFVCLASWGGVYFCICAMYAAKNYPKVSKLVAVSALIGSVILVATLLVLHFIIEMPTVHILSIPAVLLLSGVVMLLKEFKNGT